MIALPRTAGLYLAKRVLLTTLMVWLVLVGFDVILALAGDLKDIGKESYTLGQAVLEGIFTVPRRAYTIFPTAAVIGCLLGLGGLAARSELTVMRAVGISKFQIGIGALLPLMVLTVVMIGNMETLAPAGEQRALALANGKSKDLIMARYTGLWAREGNMFLNARSGAPHVENGKSWIELDDVRLYQFDPDGRLLSLAHARVADHNNEGWILHDVERSIFEPRSLRVEKKVSERWDTQLDDKSLEATLARTRYLTTAELDSNIIYLKRNQLDAGKFEGEYWSRWFYPINVIALCLATLPFAFGSLRAGGFGKRLFLGILIGIGFLQVQTMFVNLSDVYRFDVRWAYTAPPLLLLAICWGWLAKKI
jgi:lipopolysaccharide export system permease protein